jgi:very-short-patch-repair endonuclease
MVKKIWRKKADILWKNYIDKRIKTIKNFSSEKKKEISKKLSNAQKKLKRENPEYYKKIKRKAAFISAQTWEKYKINKIEQKVMDWLQNNKLKVSYSPIIGKNQYDFIVHNTKILVEVQGDYWHCNPKIYGSKKFSEIEQRQRIKIISDLKKKIYAKERGFKILCIWEQDIKNNNFEALKELII